MVLIRWPVAGGRWPVVQLVAVGLSLSGLSVVHCCVTVALMMGKQDLMAFPLHLDFNKYSVISEPYMDAVV